MTAALLALLATAALPRAWAEPREPFHVVGDIYSVGSAEVTSFLITSPKGHVLIDGGFAETAPQIVRNIDKLGLPHRRQAAADRETMWQRWSHQVQRHPWRGLIVGLAVVLVLGVELGGRLHLGAHQVGGREAHGVGRRRRSASQRR